VHQIENDETGYSSDDPPALQWNGWISRQEGWERVEKKWKVTLKKFSVPYFHLKDFAQRRGAFADWSEPKRQQLLGKLLTHLESIHM
jgi:poly-D-alanine transfer protein DltD